MVVSSFFLPLFILILSFYVDLTTAAVYFNESSSAYSLSNNRLALDVDKSVGIITKLTLDGQDLIGTKNGYVGVGPYLDCYCTPSGFWTPGTSSPQFKIFQGKDSDSVGYVGIVMSDTYKPTGQVLEFYFFLRDGETGLHTFSRLAYYNETTPFLRNLQEFRTLFRPNTALWTHLSTNEKTFAPLPSKNATSAQVTVQDATWYLGNTPEDPYVQQMADYFTKYTFQDTWRDHKVHGLYADGTQSSDGSAFGSWLVMNTVETYFNGPLNSDLVVDGIGYNYMVSNHHGVGTPNITHGFDRTFGPQYYHFNKGAKGTSLAELRADALQYAYPTWNSRFYDSIAQYVPNLVTSSERGQWEGQITLPGDCGQTPKNPIAILTVSGIEFQDNAIDTKAYQYWVNLNIGRDGSMTGSIPRVKAGTYRLTVYADGIFGDYVQDSIEIIAGRKTNTRAKWVPESAGTELWRIGTPDKSSGEYKHGYALDETHPNHPEQYRIYWAVYDYPTDFPNGVRFKVGESKEEEDMNYVHWSAFGGKANSLRNVTFVDETVNNWTIEFDTTSRSLTGKKEATFTVQLAGAKTAAGNTDIYNATEPWANLPLTTVINGKELQPWVIPYYHSSSCAVRSAVTCRNIAHKYIFPASYLKAGTNELVLSLPAGAKDYESAVLPEQVYVQYDALRLEVN